MFILIISISISNGHLGEGQQFLLPALFLDVILPAPE